MLYRVNISSLKLNSREGRDSNVFSHQDLNGLYINCTIMCMIILRADKVWGNLVP